MIVSRAPKALTGLPRLQRGNWRGFDRRGWDAERACSTEPARVTEIENIQEVDKIGEHAFPGGLPEQRDALEVRLETPPQLTWTKVIDVELGDGHSAAKNHIVVRSTKKESAGGPKVLFDRRDEPLDFGARDVLKNFETHDDVKRSARERPAGGYVRGNK